MLQAISHQFIQFWYTLFSHNTNHRLTYHTLMKFQTQVRATHFRPYSSRLCYLTGYLLWWPYDKDGTFGVMSTVIANAPKKRSSRTHKGKQIETAVVSFEIRKVNNVRKYCNIPFDLAEATATDNEKINVHLLHRLANHVLRIAFKHQSFSAYLRICITQDLYIIS